MKLHLNRASCRILLSCMVGIPLLCACTPGQDAFLQVQLCVANAQGVALFKHTLRSIAHNQHMRYIDGSAATMRDLRDINAPGKNTHKNGGLIYVGVENDDYGLTAGNLSLNRYDIAVGFGPDTPAARTFAKRVVARLKQHWVLKVVPKDSGAFPNPECRDAAAAASNSSLQPTQNRYAVSVG